MRKTLRGETVVAPATRRVSQCQKPRGWLGRLALWNMNSRHSKVTDWGLAHVSVKERDTVLDVGCGGGRTISKLVAMTAQGNVYGADFSEESVAASKRTNSRWNERGRVEIHHASVSQLPFPEGMFDLITAVETHFWWPNLPEDLREVLRVLRPGGTFLVIAEVYRGANTTMARLCEKYASVTGLTLLSVEEHREMLANAGYSEVQVVADPGKGWICATGRKP